MATYRVDPDHWRKSGWSDKTYFRGTEAQGRNTSWTARWQPVRIPDSIATLDRSRSILVVNFEPRPQRSLGVWRARLLTASPGATLNEVRDCKGERSRVRNSKGQHSRRLPGA